MNISSNNIPNNKAQNSALEYRYRLPLYDYCHNGVSHVLATYVLDTTTIIHGLARILLY